MAGTLVSTTQLEQHLDDPRWLVVDCRFDLANPRTGQLAYEHGHIPGAVYAHLDRDLSGTTTAGSGRHPLPDPFAFGTVASGWGMNTDTRVVAYDDSGGAVAARLWWLLRWLGHRDAAVLDGGWSAWTSEGRPTHSQSPQRPAGHWTPAPDSHLWVDVDSLVDELSSGACALMDARSGERYSGKAEPIDPVAGHVPGAVNVPFSGNLDRNGRFLPPEQLRRRFEALLERRPPSDAVAMCGSGVTACHLLLAMAHAGLDGGRLYPGSWSQWIAEPLRPTEPPRSR